MKSTRSNEARRCRGAAVFTSMPWVKVHFQLFCKGQIPLRYPASERELVRELVCDLLGSWSQTCSELEFGLSRTI